MFGKPKNVRRDIYMKNVYVEPKYDGFRVRLASDEQGHIALAVGRKQDYTHHFEAIRLPPDIIIDAEVIVNGSLQQTSRVLTRQRSVSGSQIEVYVFDILEYRDESVSGLGYVARRQCLTELLFPEPVYLAESTWSAEDITMEKLAQPYLERGFEGIVTKNAHGRYGEGWFKFKRQRAEDFLVCETKEGTGEWAGTVGAIQLYDLRLDQVVGWCSSGSDATRSWFTNELQGLDADGIISKGILVEVEYQQRTEDGMLRHPRLLRIRHDLMEVHNEPLSTTT